MHDRRAHRRVIGSLIAILVFQGPLCGGDASCLSERRSFTWFYAAGHCRRVHKDFTRPRMQSTHRVPSFRIVLISNFILSPDAPVFGSGYHIYEIDSNSKLVFHGATLGGVGASFSVVNDGDLLDSSHFVLAPFSLNGYQLTLDQPFLIGMHMSYLQVMTVTQERFGWARLKYTATGLQILDQATALGGNGIIAGTTTVLPEPSTLSLIAAGAVGLLFAHRRLKTRRHLEPRS